VPDQSDIRDYVASTFEGVDVQVASAEDGSPEVAWGDTFFIYDPERNLPGNKRMPFATIVTEGLQGLGRGVEPQPAGSVSAQHRS
jgi:hypothetical protein